MEKNQTSFFKITFYALMLSFATVLSSANNAWAHGGVSVEEDKCVIRIGPFIAHFTGYQPEARATQEFCEDIPVVGKAIFVVDYISDDLRTMEIEFRILKDVKALGVTAKYEQLGSEQEIDAATIHKAAPAIYPRGTINVTYPFDIKGQYIGLVRARHPGSGSEYISVFPFYVGYFHWMRYVFIIGGILLLSGILFAIFMARAMSENQQKA